MSKPSGWTGPASRLRTHPAKTAMPASGSKTSTTASAPQPHRSARSRFAAPGSRQTAGRDRAASGSPPSARSS